MMAQLQVCIFLISMCMKLVNGENGEESQCCGKALCICHYLTNFLPFVDCSGLGLEQLPNFERIIMETTTKLFLENNQIVHLKINRSEWASLNWINLDDNSIDCVDIYK